MISSEISPSVSSAFLKRGDILSFLHANGLTCPQPRVVAVAVKTLSVPFTRHDKLSTSMSLIPRVSRSHVSRRESRYFSRIEVSAMDRGKEELIFA
ncbi:hypothetical protein AVEN_213273-1 [Araneus ventricosus]|uniref:Uncharacterized protein n=1 Tax=Araneus ventricosus TaxID=182803 RepID=A0A4Y2DDV0_ARAVE|nr:hypothetical protein AVEN_213273-1 [Araneus ventricosus]